MRQYQFYKCHHRKHNSGKTAPQLSFHSHFAQYNHNGMEDWQFILIDEATDLDSLHRKESFLQCKRNTFHPNRFSVREVNYDYD